MIVECTNNVIDSDAHVVGQPQAVENSKQVDFQSSKRPYCARPNFGDMSMFIPEKRRCLTPENISTHIKTDSPDSYSYHSSHDDEYRLEFYRRRAEFYRLRDHASADGAFVESFSSVSCLDSDISDLESIWDFEHSKLALGQEQESDEVQKTGKIPHQGALEESGDEGTITQLDEQSAGKDWLCGVALTCHPAYHYSEVDVCSRERHNFPTNAVQNRSQNTTCDSYSFHSSHCNTDDDRCLLYRASDDGNCGDYLFDYSALLSAEIEPNPSLEHEWHSSKNCPYNDDYTVMFGLKKDVVQVSPPS